MPKLQPNPFIYGRPVPPSRFVGRRREVNTLFNRMLNGESTAVVGEPHIGKSSLLNYIADESTGKEWIEEYSNQNIFAFFDALVLRASDQPQQFWMRILEQVMNAPAVDDEIRQQCRLMAESNFSIFLLERLFKLLEQRGLRLVVLIDAFGFMVGHPNFYKRDFFGALRSLSVQFRSFVLVITSRERVTELNRRLSAISTGSPFMNVFIEIVLPQLTQTEAIDLIEQALKEAGGQVVFAPRDRKFLFELAGCQPFLLQTAAAALYDAYLDGTSTRAAYARTTELFHQRTELHFSQLTRMLELGTPLPPQTEAIDSMQLRLKLHDNFNLEELELLSHDLGVDYEDLGGDGKDAKALKLVLYCQRRNLLDTLLSKCMELRPNVEW